MLIFKKFLGEQTDTFQNSKDLKTPSFNCCWGTACLLRIVLTFLELLGVTLSACVHSFLQTDMLKNADLIV